jgi:hypothetical protein
MLEILIHRIGNKQNFDKINTMLKTYFIVKSSNFNDNKILKLNSKDLHKKSQSVGVILLRG